MRRTLFYSLATISLLLLFAAVALWIDSYEHAASVGWYGQYIGTDGDSSSVFWMYDGCEIRSEQGRIQLKQGSLLSGPRDGKGGLAVYRPARFEVDPQMNPTWRFGGFQMDTGGFTERFYLPHWFVICVLIIAPGVWSLQWARRKAPGADGCIDCGYDLTGNQSGQCPECGAGLESEPAAI